MPVLRIEYDVPVTMRDGVVLYADVYQPEGEGPFPVIVARTPYSKTDHYELSFLDPLLAARRGFIAVVQDVRGRYTSEGEFRPFGQEAHDGADTIAWAAQLPGSNGSVGMWGLSYLGNAQWQAAAEQPPALKAIAPERTPRSAHEGLAYRGGALELGLVRSWGLAVGIDVIARRYADSPDEQAKQLASLVSALDEIPGQTYWELPTAPDPLLTRHDLPNMAAPHVMAAADVTELQPHVRVPSLHVAGWWDVFSQPTIDNYLAAAKEGEPRLVVGPWNHIGQDSLLGDVNFGLAGNGYAINYETTVLDLTFDWLQAWLTTGQAPAGDAPVLIYVMGANEWREEQQWPLERAVDTRFYCTSEESLSTNNSGAPGSTLSFLYDPEDPVPTHGGAGLMPHLVAGSLEQSSIEQRADVLTFTSEELVEDTEVTGRVTATLTVTTDAPTTDWVVRLCDVHPDGRSFNVVDGITRIVASPHQSGQVQVDLWSTSMVFKKGHRIRVQVTSSSFPRWDRNPNTPDGLRTGQLQKVNQQLHTGGDNATFVTLPLVPPGTTH